MNGLASFGELHFEVTVSSRLHTVFAFRSFIVFCLHRRRIGRGGNVFSGRSAGRPLSINTYFTCCDISIVSGGILMKLSTNIHHVSGHC